MCGYSVFMQYKNTNQKEEKVVRSYNNHEQPCGLSLSLVKVHVYDRPTK